MTNHYASIPLKSKNFSFHVIICLKKCHQYFTQIIVLLVKSLDNCIAHIKPILSLNNALLFTQYVYIKI